MYDSVPGYEKNVHCHDRFLYDFLSENYKAYFFCILKITL